MNATTDSELPVGIFDSGVGGLTVLHAIREAMPAEHLVYLGDTARLPYGTKSPQSIERYATQAAAKLREHGIKLLVVACNTASAVALDVLREQLTPMPVVGVVEPGAAAAVEGCRGGSHLVLATEATVMLGAYRRAILSLDAQADVTEHACELLVALAEEGWVDGPIARSIVRRYLDESHAVSPDTIILGCTHFPLLTNTIRNVAGDSVRIVDSAVTTAAVVRATMDATGARRESDDRGTLHLLATDGARRFARVGGRFLGHALSHEDVELVDL